MEDIGTNFFDSSLFDAVDCYSKVGYRTRKPVLFFLKYHAMCLLHMLWYYTGRRADLGEYPSIF